MTVLDSREHVFVTGSPRSGTSLVASILLSSPLYATYRAETKLLADCEDIYGDLRNAGVRDRFWRDWFSSRQFIRSGLAKEDVLTVVDRQRSYIGILADVMGLVASKQGRERWIDSTPENAHRFADIARAFPNAKVIHVIRDGRAVSLSLAKLGWTGVGTHDFDGALYYSSLKWQQCVMDARTTSTCLDGRYFELRYEELVQAPQRAVGELCDFLGIPMVDDSLLGNGFDRDHEDAKSTLHTPNSPFGDMTAGISSNAMYRWKEVLSERQVCRVEAHIGATLQLLEYPLMCVKGVPTGYNVMPMQRRLQLAARSLLKHHTPLGRYSISPFEFEQD